VTARLEKKIDSANELLDTIVNLLSTGSMAGFSASLELSGKICTLMMPFVYVKTIDPE